MVNPTHQIKKHYSLWPWKGKVAIFFDFLFLLIGATVVYWIRNSTIYWPKNVLPLLSHRHTAIFCLFILTSFLLLHQKGIYDPSKVLSISEETKKIFWALTQSAAFLIVILFAGQILISRKLLLGLWLFSILALPGWRFILRKIYSGDLKEGNSWIKVVIIGKGENSKKLERFFQANPFLGISVWGVLEEKEDIIEKLPQILELHWIDEIIISESLPLTMIESIVLEGIKRKKRVRLLLPSLSETLHPHWEKMDFFDGLPLVPLCDQSISLFYLIEKRIIDILASFVGLLFLSPVFLLIAAIIKLQDGGPIFYCSTRVGRKGRRFSCIKFRTMTVDADKKKEALAHLNERVGPMFKITNDPRVTPFGRFLRKYSLDELPQLFNVLLGQMSLVGPRPPTPDEVENYGKYSLSYYKRLEVKPGLTSLWAVEARNDPRFERAVELDCKYIEEWTPWLDIKIILRTIPVVFRGEGK
ncbi:sugar transferase [Candidatus Methylacidiphilum fumarolicum]|uniref:Sugar transferase, WcaJ family n=2 Tax=Candidatus Methylacidiphilum fumarolicum TaxID=591154 RepID=I0JYZ0_METFB|nr:sugar transferase [Candidatus Methylacidiphilum fumarolicum]CCG92459.1 Sugar transferase, WcaJ family [Methylacidiphilum fumariolicum SolV]TFE65645.1 sugar transferase [Candidatus Methylacidiphilum fumarolicum]TFE74198.1 sugar transferase [Candidatus Methylacidiphilum fumarolicum]TFE75697.1 sugar transferase [Candidatus Methylacidiphilum fumarolicum]